MARSKAFFFAKLLRLDPTTGNFKVKSEVGESVDNKNVAQVKVARDASDSGNVLPNGWSCRKDGSNSLVFLYNNTVVAKINSDGEIVSADDVTAFGTV